MYIIIYCKRVFRTALGVQILLQHLRDVLHLIEMNNENNKQTVKAEHMCDKVVCISDQLWHGSTTKK